MDHPSCWHVDAHELLENNAAHLDLINMLDWYFLPVHNPDGYYKTRQEVLEEDRLWKKSTSNYNGGNKIEL